MLKIYGSKLCPDCIDCVRELTASNVDFEYCDFGENLLYLKEFLKIRDESREFDEIRMAGKIGIPCILREDGSLTLSWSEFLK